MGNRQGHLSGTLEYRHLKYQCFQVEAFCRVSQYPTTMFSYFRRSRKDKQVTKPTSSEPMLLSATNTQSLPTESLPDFPPVHTTAPPPIEPLPDFLPVDSAADPPINRIPTDLLQKIFLLCLRPNGTFGYVTDYSILNDDLNGPCEYIEARSGKPPLGLCIVCKHWRNVALSTPLLWSNLRSPIQEDYGHHSSARLAEVWFSRSGSAPLTLNFSGGATHGSKFQPFLSIINSHCHHLQHLRVYSAAEISIDDTLLSTLTPPRILASLSITMPFISTPCNTGFLAWIRLMLGSSSLSSFALIATNITASQLPIPFTQLTCLELGLAVNAREVLEILHASHLLTRFTIYSGELPSTMIDGNNDHLRLPSFTHTSIVKLEIHATSWTGRAGVSLILNNLTTPSLHELSVHGPYGTNYSPDFKEDFNILPFLARSAPPLERLDFTRTGILSAELLGCMQVVSATLLRLRVEEKQHNPNSIGDTILTRMTAQPDIVPLCPLIEVLYFLRTVDSSDGCLAAMIQSRCFPENHPGFATLKGVELVELPGGNVKDREKLKAIMDSRGGELKLSIREIRRRSID